MQTIKSVISLWILAVCLLCSIDALSQKAIDDIAKINEVYAKNKSLSFHTVYSVYATYTSIKPAESSPGMVKMKDDKMYYKIGGLEVMQNLTYVFSVNHDQKSLVILSRQKGKNFTEQVKPDLAKILKQCKSITYFDAGKGMGGYEMVYPSQSFSKMRFVFDKKTFLIESFSLYYKDEQTYAEGLKSKVRIEIKYSDYQMGGVIPDDAFTYSKYLTKVGKFKYTVKEPYLNYRFLNNVEQ